MFCELKNKNKFALMPFIMAGDPNIEITSEILLKLQDNGADLIELGIPSHYKRHQSYFLTHKTSHLP